MSYKNEKWKKAFVFALDFAALFVFIFAGRITAWMMREISPCGIYEKWGIKCLTCGGTRCVNALSRGEIAEAFGYNAYVPVAIVVTSVLIILLNLAWVLRMEKTEVFLKKLCDLKLVAVISIITALYIFFRNVIPIIGKIF